MEEHLFSVEDAKRCCTCKVVQPLDAFNRMKKSPDGRQASCRECNRRYHYKNWDRHMAQIRRRKRDRFLENRERLLVLLLETACTDCGETDPLVLEFDHLRDKRSNISNLVASGFEWAYIEEEISRCEVVCSNCHRRRTAKRSNSYRYRWLNGEDDSSS